MNHLTNATWMSPCSALVLLSHDWTEAGLPKLEIEGKRARLARLARAPLLLFGELCNYFIEADGQVVFICFQENHPHLNFGQLGLRVAGPFNEWGKIGRNPAGTSWDLQPECIDGRAVWVARVPKEAVLSPEKPREAVEFKFVTHDWHWLTPDYHAPNLRQHKGGICNYALEPQCSGRHAFTFDLEETIGLGAALAVQWAGHLGAAVPIRTGAFFYRLRSAHPLGAHLEGNRTIFRLFAPRASTAAVVYADNPAMEGAKRTEMEMLEDGLTWEGVVSRPLVGWYYFLHVAGHSIDHDTHFDAEMPLLDPWALATVGPRGPGIILDRTQLPRPTQPFTPPRWNNLVICEAHVRDLVRNAPGDLDDLDRQGFTGVTKWLDSQACYLRELGVNAVELQPLQQNDAPDRESYHWGYMTNNYFAPNAFYSRDPARASGVAELAEMVATFHRHGLAVILDVVYNHVGEPNFLLFFDKQYYFHITPTGELINWSGCGNTLRAESAMATQLICESLVHLVKTFDFDGFRFDLAELIGIEVLKQIEVALKAVKPGIILIAEPWSFRGHIAADLKATGWAFWNDGFREFIPRYLKGRGNTDGIKYYLSGCLSHLTRYPAQSVNYVESHDDRAFIDKLTERPHHDGSSPTERDRQRAHLMIALLMTSLGTPMLSAGQDWLRSKHGKNNTYLDGAENGLRYGEAERQAHTVHYFRQWIRFRLGEFGQVFRLWERPGDGYTHYWEAAGCTAVAAWTNGDHRYGPCEVLFAINPHTDRTAHFHLGGLDGRDWQQIANRHDFKPEGLGYSNLHGDHLEVEPLGLCLLVKKKA